MDSDDAWHLVGRPGPFGSERDRLSDMFDARFGRGAWRLVWSAGERLLPFEGAALIYEDAYAAWFDGAADRLDDLAAAASDVYDNALSNLAAGLDFGHQESDLNHLQDIAIRRVMVRRGRVFRGVRPIQIRGDSVDPLGVALSPGRIPFHRPEWIPSPALAGWWQPGSIEDYYQSAKFLQVRRTNRSKLGRLSDP